MKFSKSFTLIEMLIVIVIIGILAAALIPRLVAVQGRARDTERKFELNQIRTALEIYYSDRGVYPIIYPNNYWKYSTNNLPLRITWLESILTSLPVDPINNYSGPNDIGGTLGDNLVNPDEYAYTYHYFWPDDQVSVNGKGTFLMYGVLENKTDPDRCEVKQYLVPLYDGSTMQWCDPNVGSYLYTYDASSHGKRLNQ